MSIEEVEREALSLTPAARAKLAHDLVLSLAQMNEQEIEALWLAEAARRDQEMDEGRVKGIPGDEVFARIRARFIWHGSVRAKILSGFPYTVFYSIKPGELRILAVAHQHQQPMYWLGRR
jgi:putative addiction module component (TIGR02574 family)